MEARSDRHSTDAEATIYDEQRRSRRTLAPNGPSGGATDEFRDAEPPDTHSLSTGGVGYVEHLAYCHRTFILIGCSVIPPGFNVLEAVGKRRRLCA